MEITTRINEKMNFDIYSCRRNEKFNPKNDKNLNVITFSFGSEKKKNKLGKHLKEVIKNIHEKNTNLNEDYTSLELKYKIGRDIESNSIISRFKF